MDTNIYTIQRNSFAKNRELALHIYKHAHYVAASCVPSLLGLQIINWSLEYIGVNTKVEEHMSTL